MSKLYIVVDISFDYNDEIYSSVEGNGGEPIKAFKDKKKAEAHCDQLNIEELRGLNLNEYCYGIDDICDDSHALLSILHGEPEDDYQIPSDLSEEKIKQVLNLINIEFFKVVEVDQE